MYTLAATVQAACHPSFPLLALRTAPQMGAHAAKYTTSQWDATLKRLVQNFEYTSANSERLDVAAPAVTSTGRLGPCFGPTNKAAGSYAVLRGASAASVDASLLARPDLFAAAAVRPLTVAASSSAFQNLATSCTLLSSDRVRLRRCRAEVLPQAWLHTWLSCRHAAYNLEGPSNVAAR